MPLNNKKNINIWLNQIEKEYKIAHSVDCVIFGFDQDRLKVLVLDCNMPPFQGMPSLVGDLVRPDENFEEAARRILEERTGIEDLYLEQVYTFGEIDRHPLGRVISTAYFALLKTEDYNPQLHHKETQVKWVNIENIGQLAFDHNRILDECLERLQFTVKCKPIIFSLLPEKFTLKQLQCVYEVILGQKFDKRNFRRKVKNFNALIEHKDGQQEVNHRPAKYYSFDYKLNIHKNPEENNFSI